MEFTLRVPLVFFILFFCCVSCQSSYGKLWNEEERSLLLSGLIESHETLLTVIEDAEDSLWTLKPAGEGWSQWEVVEHLVLQEQLYYREISILSFSPPRSEFVSRVSGNDQLFEAYASDPQLGNSGWYAKPTGRFCARVDALSAFSLTRNKLIELVQTTDADFRQIFTFRSIPEEVMRRDPEFYKIREVRDLHQLVLNQIAHTKRHIQQIKNI